MELEFRIPILLSYSAGRMQNYIGGRGQLPPFPEQLHVNYCIESMCIFFPPRDLLFLIENCQFSCSMLVWKRVYIFNSTRESLEAAHLYMISFIKLL